MRCRQTKGWWNIWCMRCTSGAHGPGTPAKGAVAVAYARQLPREDCGIIERYTRQFNYPDEGCVKSREDIPRLGIKTFFCSDVCAAYRRDLFEQLGGFESPVIFNEDMFFRGACSAGRIQGCVCGGRRGGSFAQLFGEAAVSHAILIWRCPRRHIRRSLSRSARRRRACVW